MKKNGELRVKYPEDPMKFMDSEIELDESLKKLSAIIGSPDLYAHMKELRMLSMLTQLLLHENVDIALEALKLIEDISDAEVIREEFLDENYDEQIRQVFNEWLMNEGLLEALIQNLKRLNEFESEEDRIGVFQTLSILENLVELQPAWSEVIFSRTGDSFLPWMLHRLGPELMFDSNKQYISELLAILLQTSTKNRLLFVGPNYGGINALLIFLAPYKDNDPRNGDEMELMENWFDALCSCLLEKESKIAFMEAEGIELMLLMIRNKNASRRGALKALTHALTNSMDLGLADQFIKSLGLKILFGAFMRPIAAIDTKRKKLYKNYSEKEEDEYIMSLIYALFRYAQDHENRKRLNYKFIERDYEKISQLVELHAEYVKKVATTDQEIQIERNLDKLEHSKQQNIDNAGNVNIKDEEDIYLRQLDGGLFTLQMIDAIIGCLIYFVDIQIRETLFRKLKQYLSLKNSSLEKIFSVLHVYAKHLGDEETKDRDFLYILAEAVQKVIAIQ